jgi:hypothetical protein
MIFLFRPDIPRDKMYPPHLPLPPDRVMETVAALEPGQNIRLRLFTEFYDGTTRDQVVVLPFEGETAEERLESAGAYLAWDGDKLMVDDVAINSRLEGLGVNMEDPTEVLGTEVPAGQPPKWLFSLPGLGLWGLVLISQLRRRRREKVEALS